MSCEVVTISDPATGSTASVAPALGFNLFSFRACEQGEAWDVLWHDPAFTTGTTRPSRSGIPLLFPFPGRLRGKQLIYAGRTFHFDTTDPLGNAIHGFVHTRPWRVIEQLAQRVTGEFHATLDDPTLLERWPGDFRIRASYEISGNTLHASYEILNPGDQPLPWGLGTHPYFRISLGSGDGSQSRIRIPVTARWELRDMLPTGQRLPVENASELASGIPFAGLQLDDVFTGLVRSDGVFTGSVTDPFNQRETTVQFGDPFGECVVFTPPTREAICIEPYSCVPDAYRLGEQGVTTGLQLLAPGDTFTATMIVTSHAI